MADLTAARDALDRMIDIANHPTPEHCPALREPAWAPYNPSPADADDAPRRTAPAPAAALPALSA